MYRVTSGGRADLLGYLGQVFFVPFGVLLSTLPCLLCVLGRRLRVFFASALVRDSLQAPLHAARASWWFMRFQKACELLW